MRLFLKRFFICFFCCVFSQSLLAQDMRDLELASKNKSIKKIKIKNLSDLQALTPYESVAVIQKRYLPKTFRGEFNLSVASIVNHKYSYFGGLSARAGFFLRENHGLGLEFLGPFLPLDKPVKKELILNQDIISYTTSKLRFYGGAYYKWSPVFGKFSVLNNKIVYFDMYLTLGAGVSHFVEGITEQDKKNFLEREGRTLPDVAVKLKSPYPFTGSLSLGQVFALSKDWALNWEIKWFYTIIELEEKNKTFLKTPVNIVFSLGANYYFPGASYR